MSTRGSNPKNVRVYVHLGHGFGAKSWRSRYARGLIPGLNDCLAYGYFRAAGGGWSIEYSEDGAEGPLQKLWRIGLRRLIGADLIHAWRNRARIFSADVVWTHTELDCLAALVLCIVSHRRRRPKIIANCVWLFDGWTNLSWIKRTAYRALLRRAAVVTTFSPINIEVAKRILPETRCEFVFWGVTVEDLKRPIKKTIHSPLRIVSLGSDKHRDWEGLISAFGNRKGYKMRLASRAIGSHLLAGVENVKVVSISTAGGIKELYDWADFVVVSLKPNLHASGITVILESIIVAVPVVCTDTGGLRAYVSPQEVRYVPPKNPAAMRAAVDDLAGDDMRRFSMTVNAQRRLISANLTTEGFAARHRRLSEEILARATKPL